MGSPITSRKLYCIPSLISAVKNLTYQDKEVLFCDNSPDTTVQETLEKFPEVKTIKTEFYRKDKDGKILFKELKTESNVIKVAEEIPIREMMVRDLNYLRKKALTEGFDYLLILEQDIVPHPDIIERLMAYDKDVMNAFYWTSPKYIMTNGLKGITTILPLFKSARTNDGEEVGMILNPIELNEMYPSKVLEIRHFGFGCCLIKRKVLEQVEFFYDQNYKGQVDVNFYNSLNDKGFKAYVDTGLIVQHNHVDWNEGWKK